MKRASDRRVANPPSKPLMLFDGDCHFCRRWIERWKGITRGRVEYEPYQESLARFPEIPAEECARAVQLVETDGIVYRAAEAVFRSLGYGRGGGWLSPANERVPGFAATTEFAYAIVARNRNLASKTTRLLWGEDVRKPTYFAARRGFLKTLGLVYLFAFVSLWWQVDGLMGHRGILPARDVLQSMRDASGGSWMSLALMQPTLCWLNSSDAMLHGLCLVGTLAALLLTFGILPIPTLATCFVCYLSLLIPGEIFFSYQWDILLLETGFVALFLAPAQWCLRRGNDAPVSGMGLFLAKMLLFKLMFMSGVVKLTSGDTAWLDLTALNYHYWTQPLPTVFAWFADKDPEWLKKLSAALVFGVEIGAPFFIWAPRRLRVGAAWAMIALQVAIAGTGNYCFFNILTIALCLLLFDDWAWAPQREREIARPGNRWLPLLPAAAILVTLPVNLWLIYTAILPQSGWPATLTAIYSRVAPFHIAEGYGLFRVMTRERQEIIFEGSTDAFDWQPYEFKWKPGDLQRAPQWNAPHQPRLDWSMWFAALGSQRDRVVAERLVERLLENEPTVLKLLGTNPFPNQPPQFIRASLYDYRFTSSEERARTGDWWKRRLRSQYLPTLSLRDFRR